MSDTALIKSYATTGSITGGTNTLTVASNPGFIATNHIIVELGTEAQVPGMPAPGMRGTIGVGGSWPSLNYADAATRTAATPPAEHTYAWDRNTGNIFRFMDSAWRAIGDTAKPALSYVNADARNADNSQADGTYAWDLDSGLIWQYVSGAWTFIGGSFNQLENSYYYQLAIPRSLCTTIDSIDGTGLIFTLHDPAVVTATNANVYFDNLFYLNGQMKAGSGFTPNGNTWLWPSGTFALSDRPGMGNHDNWTIQGAGIDSTILLYPKGCGSGLYFVNCSGLILRDFSIVGNLADNGWGWHWGLDVTPVTTETNFEWNSTTFGVYIDTCSGIEVRNVKVTNVFRDAVSLQNSTNSNYYNCSCYMTNPLRSYFQWCFNISSCTNCHSYDTYLNSAYWIAGIEIIVGSGNSHVRATSINGHISLNQTNDWQHVDLSVTFYANSFARAPFSVKDYVEGNPIVNVNANTPGAAPDGGQLIRPTVRFIGAAAMPAPDNGMFAGIVIDYRLQNISITGTYPNDCSPKGLVEFPDYVAGNIIWQPQIGDNVIAYPVSVSGMRIIGSQTGNIYSQIDLQGGGTVDSCVVDSVQSAITPTHIQNNAAYNASYPVWYAANCLVVTDILGVAASEW